MNKHIQLQFLSRRTRLHWVRSIGCGMLLFLACVYGTAFGQAKFTVSGKVTDKTTGEALPGVNILIKSTSIGTATSPDGTYVLNVPSQTDTLVFSYIGYGTEVVAVNGQTTIDVKLTSAQITGQQLLVVGYSTQKKKDLTGSVSVVNTQNLVSQPVGEVTKQLQGQAAGVTVVSSGQPGEAPQVHIRGFNTFGNNTPLYVIDGVPTQNISDLNPSDIASMQVLKDASSSSIYGARASNGVIIITTKKGQGKINVSYDSYWGMQYQKSGNVWDILSPQGMADLAWMAYANAGEAVSTPLQAQYGSGAKPVLPNYILPAGASTVDASKYYVDPNYTDPAERNSFYQIIKANKSGTNWYQEVMKPAPEYNSNLTVSGGGQAGNYLFSFNYLNRQGTYIYTYLKRYAVRANTNFNVTQNIRVGENLEYSSSVNPTASVLQEGGGIGMSYREQPIIPVYDIGGNFAGTQAPGLGNPENPYADRYRTRNNGGVSNRLFGNMFAEVDLMKNLTLRTSFGGEMYSSTYHQFNFPTYENAEPAGTNSYAEQHYSGRNWTWTNTATYQKTFAGIHDVKVVVGSEAYNNSGLSLTGQTQGYFSFDPNFTTLSTGSGIQTNGSSKYHDKLFSLFGRVNYSYNDKYLFSATLRRDGSSKFVNNQYGFFPAASIGWRVSQESFMQNITWISDLKLRAGYGVMGNQLNVDPNNGYTLYVGDKQESYYDITGNNTSIATGFQQNRYGNPNAKWEKDTNSDFGIDATLFDGHLMVTGDYYIKDIKDLLYNPQLPGTAGLAAQPYVNVASMQNRGFDGSLEGTGTLTGDLKYDATLTITSYTNKIVKIANNQTYFDADGRRFNGGAIIRNAVGHAMSSFYGYKIVGFFNSQSEINNLDAKSPTGTYEQDEGVGRFKYADTNGDGVITADDRQFLGSPNPKFTYGFNLGLTYKNWDFSAFIYGVQGNKLWNQVKWWTDFYNSFQGAKSNTALYDSWTPQNHNATAPIQEPNSYFSTNSVPNSYYVENGSYMRLKNIQIGYTLPGNFLRQYGVSKLRVYVQGANLFTATKYTGLDPEVGFNQGAGNTGSYTDFGVDEGSYATPREIIVGVNLKF